MYVTRLIEKTLKSAVKTFPAVIITGPRQSGKTTLVKHVLGASYNYVSLDELDIRSFAIEDPRGFLERNSSPLIINEIQNAQGLLPYIKAKIDQERKPGQWILTGSQQFTLMRHISESLAGRVAMLTLYPFSLAEMNNNLKDKFEDAALFLKNAAKENKLPDHYLSHGTYLLNGGYPELFVNDSISKRLWFSSYVQAYIDRDVRGNIKISNLHEFEKFLKLLAARTAQELNYSNLAQECGVSVPTIKSWVSLLEACSVIYLLYPYYKNFGKRIIKSPKVYFIDTGLVCYLVGLYNEEHLLNGPMAGALFETAIITEFVKRFTALMYPANLYFWKSVSGFEVDLLIETSQDMFPIEIKLSSTLSPKSLVSLRKWLSLLKDKREEYAFVVSTSKRLGFIDRNISNIHFSLL